MTISPLPTSGAELSDLDRRHLIHPLQRGDVTDRIVMVHGSGAQVWDADGNEYLDATGGGNWHSHIGHGRPAWTSGEAAWTTAAEPQRS
jgi:adenosylmethionine-8-amino-7-oxononanoate aminotransferase